MKIIGKTLILLWKFWFLLTALITILILLPFLIIFSVSPKTFKQFFVCERIWAKAMLFLNGFPYKVEYEAPIEKGKKYIYCANHSSLIDIPLTLAIIPNPFLFIGKVELAKYPLFGYFYKRTNILVDRSSIKSRQKVYEDAKVKIDEGYGICIYPEGGIPRGLPKLGNFKMGAFKLAIEKQIPIIPITFADNRRLYPAELFFKGKPGLLRVTIHKPLEVEGLTLSDQHRLKEECYDIMDKRLTEYGVNA